jgi:hypothetical protein
MANIPLILIKIIQGFFPSLVFLCIEDGSKYSPVAD